MIYDSIIIGAGPAGLTAAIYASRKKMNVLILAKEKGGQFSLAYDIENYPGFLKITGLELIGRIEEQVKKYGVEIKKSEVENIKKAGSHFLVTTGKENFEAKTVIIASGRTPKELNVAGAEEFQNRGVSFCTTCDAPVFFGKDVAIIGGGNSALKSALDLLPYANKIYLLQHRGKFIGDEETIEKLKKSGKATFLVNAEIREIRGKKLVESLIYEDLITKKQKELAVNGVFVNIGQSPNADFAENFLEINDKGEIVIEPATNKTSKDGVFAAGDVTNIPYKQYIVAAGEGAKAALSAHEYLLKNT